jgi:hypothetical protein
MPDNEQLAELERRIRQAEEANATARRELANRRSELSAPMRRSLWMLAMVALILAAGTGGRGESCGRTQFCLPAGQWM